VTCKTYRDWIYNHNQFIRMYTKSHGINLPTGNEGIFRSYIQLRASIPIVWIIPNFRYFISLYKIVRMKTQVMTIDSKNSRITVSNDHGYYSFVHNILCEYGLSNYALWITTNKEFETFLKDENFEEDGWISFLTLKEFVTLHCKKPGDLMFKRFQFAVCAKKKVDYNYCSDIVRCKPFSRETTNSLKNVICVTPKL
jgi:hypothetical protein